ncbi:MAG: hypothetical protein ACYTKD_18175 [Planctomycetota bacterium]
MAEGRPSTPSLDDQRGVEACVSYVLWLPAWLIMSQLWWTRGPDVVKLGVALILCSFLLASAIGLSLSGMRSGRSFTRVAAAVSFSVSVATAGVLAYVMLGWLS